MTIMDNKMTNIFLKQIIERCKKYPATIGFPESNNPQVLEACLQLLKQKAVSRGHLFSEKDSVIRIARSNKIELEEFAEFLSIHPVNVGYTPLQQATLLLHSNEIDSVVAGIETSTANIVTNASQNIGMKAPKGRLSGSFVLANPNTSQQFIFADCAVTPEPTVDEICQTAINSVHTWKAIHGSKYEPHVAFLSFSTKGSSKHKDAQKIEQATKQFKKLYPEINSDGELQFDSAVCAKIRNKKDPDSSLSSNANIFIFPNLAAGNITYKALQLWGGFEAYGPLLQGLKRPFADLSRGASVEDIVITSCINILCARS